MADQRSSRLVLKALNEFQNQCWSTIVATWARVSDALETELPVSVDSIGFSSLPKHNKLTADLQSTNFVCDSAEELLLLLSLRVPPFESEEVSHTIRINHTGTLMEDTELNKKVKKLTEAGVTLRESSANYDDAVRKLKEVHFPIGWEEAKLTHPHDVQMYKEMKETRKRLDLRAISDPTLAGILNHYSVIPTTPSKLDSLLRTVESFYTDLALALGLGRRLATIPEEASRWSLRELEMGIEEQI